jgi:hypothetical protein
LSLRQLDAAGFGAACPHLYKFSHQETTMIAKASRPLAGRPLFTPSLALACSLPRHLPARSLAPMTTTSISGRAISW